MLISAAGVLNAGVTATASRAASAQQNQDKDYPDTAVRAATAAIGAATVVRAAGVTATAEDQQKDNYPEAVIVGTRIEHKNYSPFFYVTVHTTPKGANVLPLSFA